MDNRGATVLYFVLFLLLVPPASAIQQKIANAINTAGLQRMLTQRIGKTYCQIGLGVEVELSKQQLSEAVQLFDNRLTELEASITSKLVKEALFRVRVLWEPVKSAATGQISREGAKKAAYWSDDLLFATHKVVQLLQDVENSREGQLVNIAGRQRMLSQRLSKLYMLQAWGFQTRTIHDELESTRNEFSGALIRLRGAPENTREIKRKLDIVARDWRWLRKAMDMTDTDPFLKTVADLSESILVNMHDVTNLYEQLATQAKAGTSTR